MLTGMDIKTLNINGRNEWHQWLSQNHSAEKEAWLIIRKKNSGKPGLYYDEALEEAICFGWIDGIMRSIDRDKFVLRFSPRKSRSIWSMKNKEKAQKLINNNRMTDAGLAKVEEAKRNGLWEKAYTNLIRDEIPDDLYNALSQNKDSWDNFHNFANSYRNIYVGWVNSARTEKTRKQRIVEVIKRSALNKKPGIE